MTAPVLVVLNEADQRLARYLAIARHRFNLRVGSVNRKCDESRTDDEIHFDGVAAEVAYCKLFNLFPDTNTEGPADYDAIHPDGTKVDVKTTRWARGRLLVMPHKKKRTVDFYCLMICNHPTYRFVGYMAAAEICVPDRMHDCGQGAAFAARQDELLPELPARMLA